MTAWTRGDALFVLILVAILVPVLAAACRQSSGTSRRRP